MTPTTPIKKKLFCAHDQAETDHTVTVTGGDYVFACDCGRFMKFPVTLSAEELKKAIAAHKEVNQGMQLVKTEADQIEVGGMTMAEVDAALAKLEAIS